MPQLTTKGAEIEGFQAAATRAGAEYREIALMTGRPQMLARFANRAAAETGQHRHIDEIVARGGGAALLTRIHEDLTEYLDRRPHCVVVPTDDRDPSQIYDDVIAVLTGP